MYISVSYSGFVRNICVKADPLFTQSNTAANAEYALKKYSDI